MYTMYCNSHLDIKNPCEAKIEWNVLSLKSNMKQVNAKLLKLDATSNEYNSFIYKKVLVRIISVFLTWVINQ